jgi:hypothetical protein
MHLEAPTAKTLPRTRLETISRSEQDHMSTLKLVLLSDPQRGIDAFLEILEERVPEARLFEHDGDRDRCPVPSRPAPDHWTPERLQFGLEVRLSDDLKAAGLLGPSDLTGRQIPDAILMLQYPDECWHAIVIEAKLLNGLLSVIDLDSQMADQREHQIRLLPRFEPTLRAYRHIALLPRPLPAASMSPVKCVSESGWLSSSGLWACVITR